MLTRNEINGTMRYLTVRETPVPKESEELEVLMFHHTFDGRMIVTSSTFSRKTGILKNS